MFTPVTQQRTAVVIPDSGQTQYKFCPVCKVKVKTGRLERHLRKVHKSMKKRAGADTPIVNSVKDVLRDTTTLVSPRDKKLDATELYVHSYRESGRFDSHPSHDGFDDESGPD